MVTVTGGDRDVWRCWHHFPSIRSGSRTRHVRTTRLAPPLPHMPSAAIPPSPSSRCSAPQSLIHFPFSTQALHYDTHRRTRKRRKVRPAVASPPLLTRLHPHSGPGAHPHSHTPAPVAHRRHPQLAPVSARAHWTEMPAIPHESPRHHKRVKYDTNARRHQPRQPARTRPARSLHLRPPVTTHSHSGRRGTRLSRADGW
ncbi:hypothetical protein C8R43DRAFT_1034709 [Mycena crocata]|nr:hypothetical protein C8R43DRAFT_1034709 [Mycena crocata]